MTTLLADDEFDSRLAAGLGEENGPAIVALLLKDPRGRFAREFNRHMGRVDGESTEFAYLSPLAVMAVKVEQGLIPDVETLFKVLSGVQKRTALKLTALAFRRENPRMRVRRRGDDSPPESRPLFVPMGENADRYLGRESDPSFPLARQELFRQLLAEARTMTRLERLVFRAVKQFWHERKTKFGAFVAEARRAEVDATGRLVAIRVRPANPATQQEPPSQEIVRQVRRCFHKAKNHLDRRRKERDGDE